MRHAYTLAEQIVVSATIFFVNVNTSRSLSVEGYGQFVLLFTAAVLAVGLQRAAFFEPLLVLSAGRENITTLAIRHSIVGSVTLGFIFVLIAGGLMWVVSPGIVSLLCSLVLIGPFLQDAMRLMILVLRGPGAALVVTGICATIQVVTALLVNSLTTPTAAFYLGAWGAAAFLGAVASIAVVVNRLRSLRRGPAPTEFRRQTRTFGLDYLLGVASLQGTLIAATVAGGPAAAAALRGADALVGPVRVLMQSLPQLLLRKWAVSTPTGRSAACLKVSSLIAIPMILAALGTLLVPEYVGALFMGASWYVVQPVLPIVIVAMIPIVLTQLSSLALKAAGHGRQLLTARLTSVPVTLSCGVAGAAMGASVGAALGSLVGSLIASAVFWTTLWRTESAKGK